MHMPGSLNDPMFEILADLGPYQYPSMTTQNSQGFLHPTIVLVESRWE